MRALRYGEQGIDPIVEYLEQCESLDCLPRLVLLDAQRKGSYGGTGQPLDWRRLALEKRAMEVPLILAGGLTPENVAKAVAAVEPAGMDTATGVEYSPGRKDLARLKSFIAAARAALDAAS